jgi:hypothetical protein
MKNMMTYYEVLTKDSLGSRKVKAQTDKDNIKFDEEAVRKKQKKIDSETLSIANAVEASKEVRLRGRVVISSSFFYKNGLYFYCRLSSLVTV